MTEKEIQDLALKFLKGQTTKEEEVLLHSWYESKGKDDEEQIVNTNDETSKNVQNRLFFKIQDKIKEEVNISSRKNNFSRRRIYLAASIVMILSITSLYFYLKNQAPAKTYYTQLLKNDVGPGGNNAILELGDGTKINLDQAYIGNVTENNGLIVSKLADGVLALEISGSQKKEASQINTIHTPKGGQYRIKLPD